MASLGYRTVKELIGQADSVGFPAPKAPRKPLSLAERRFFSRKLHFGGNSRIDQGLYLPLCRTRGRLSPRRAWGASIFRQGKRSAILILRRKAGFGILRF
jgi:hypothetical protein